MQSLIDDYGIDYMLLIVKYLDKHSLQKLSLINKSFNNYIKYFVRADLWVRRSFIFNNDCCVSCYHNGTHKVDVIYAKKPLIHITVFYCSDCCTNNIKKMMRQLFKISRWVKERLSYDGDEKSWKYINKIDQKFIDYLKFPTKSKYGIFFDYIYNLLELQRLENRFR